MTPGERSDQRYVVVGRISGVFGVKGWVRVFSYTNPPDSILDYGPWQVGDPPGAAYRVLEGSQHGRGIIVHLEGVNDRDAARALIGNPISVRRSEFAGPAQNEFYWTDLLGLDVVNEDGVALGTVEGLMETGANDVLVVQGERRRLVPFIMGAVVRSVDLDAGRIRVDWSADY